MMLKKPQKTRLKHSFTKIAQAHETVSTLFYDKLFELAPEVRPLFLSDMADQRVKLMQMLAMMIASLEDETALMKGAQALGVRHLQYGTKGEHYVVVGEALIWALKEALPKVMTPPVVEAWEEIYAVIAEAAITAASEASMDKVQE
jgi:hemoglobin-like flavoprotein